MTQSDRAIKKLATDLARIKHEVVSWRGAQADFTSIENGGNFTFKDGDGNVTAIMGGQDDGSNTIRHVDGPIPPIPSGLTAHVDGPIVQVSWDGTFEGADNATYDWSHLEVIVVGPGNEQLTATINDITGASTSVAATVSGEWTVVARSVSRAEKRSLDGDAGTVTVEVVDLSGAIEAAIGSANGKNTVHYSEVPPTPADEGVLGDTWFVNQVNPETGTMLITEQWQYVTEWVQTELNHQVIATVDLGKATVGELDGIRIMGQTVRGEQLSGDAIDGKVITGPTIQSGRSGRRWIGDTNGIRIINDDEDVRTQLSPDGSTFKGEVEADTLVVNGGAEFKGNNTLAQGAKFTLAAGVTDPTAPPVVQPYWDGLRIAKPATGRMLGLAYTTGKYWTFRTSVDRLISFDATTGTQTDSFPMKNSSGTVDPFWGSSGVTAIGDELFVLGEISGAPHHMFVRVYSTSGAFLREWEYLEAGWSPTNPLTYKPGIGNDGTNIVIAHCYDTGQLAIRTYNKSTGSQIGATVSDGGDSTKSDITGVYVGNADWGRKLVTVAKASSSKLPSFSATTGVYDGAATQFDAAAPGSVGVVFHDGMFRTLDPAGKIHEYADANTGDGSGDWWATYYWYTDVDDDDIIESTDYQSRMAPPARFTWPRRAGLKILGQPMPTGVEALGPALAKKTSAPTRTDFHGPSWSVDAGKPSARYTSLPANWATFASPSATNTFPEATSSALESASGTFQVKGDGSGHWGPLTMGRDGIMSGLIVSGSATAYVDTANTSKKFTVQLPPGRFTKPPVVWVQVSTAIPNRAFAGVVKEEIGTTSFGFWFNRHNTTTTSVTWFAMDSE